MTSKQYDTIRVFSPESTQGVTYRGKQIAVEATSAAVVPSVEVEITAIQNLNGYDCPWPAGADDNLLPFPYTTPTETRNGVTFTVSSDGTVSLSGTATQNITFALWYNIGTALTEGVKYYIYGDSRNYAATGVGYLLNSDYDGLVYDDGNGIEFIYRGATDDLLIGLSVGGGTNTNGMTFRPMVTTYAKRGSNYSPYSNFCPISGTSSLNLYDRVDISTSYERIYTKALGRTVYDGTFEFVSGALTSNYGVVTLTSSAQTWTMDSGTATRGFYADISAMQDVPHAEYDTTKCISSHFKWGAQTTLNQFGSFYYADGSVYICDFSSHFASLAEFTSWLDAEQTAGRPVQIMYPLASPVTAALTGQTITPEIGQNYFDTSNTAEDRFDIAMVLNDAVTLPRPTNFAVKREDIYGGSYTTCTGATRADRIGWKYADMDWSWPALRQVDVEKLIAIDGESTLTFDDPTSDAIEETIIRNSVVSMRNRHKFEGEYWWSDVSCSIRFLDSHPIGE